MPINIGMEHANQLDIRKTNNAAMAIAIADFFTVRIYMSVPLSIVILDE